MPPRHAAAPGTADQTVDQPAPAATSRHRRTLSFVRRSGRMTEAQDRAWEELAPTYVLELPRADGITSVATDARIDLAELFGRDAPLVIEVGSGQGHAIVHAADRSRDTNFLAIEVFRSGLARTMLGAEQAAIDHLRLIEANAPEVFGAALPEASADEVWVFFPDPWKKTKHVKRRLIAPEFVGLAARVLKPGGVLRLATDWEDYAFQMRDVLDAAEHFTRDFAGDWAERFDGRVITAFERKGAAVGRDIRDLSYRRVGETTGE